MPTAPIILVVSVHFPVTLVVSVNALGMLVISVNGLVTLVVSVNVPVTFVVMGPDVTSTTLHKDYIFFFLLPVDDMVCSYLS